MTATLEKVTYRLAAGVTEEAFLKESETLSALIRRQPGFGYRTLVMDGSGLWADLVFWDSEKNARAAGEKIMQSPEAGPFMAMIAEGSVSMEHLAQRHIAMAGEPVPA